MAEALGLTASIIAVVQISEQVISACYQYYSNVKDAKEDILDVINVIGGLKTTLDSLRILLDKHNDPDDRQLLYLKPLVRELDMCQDTLKKLGKKLGIEIEGDVNTDDLKFSFRHKLTWPWKEKGVSKILGIIDQHKSTFILALAGDNLAVSLAIEDAVRNVSNGVEEINEGIKTMTIDHKTQQILDWLKLGHPSTNHDTARKKHEPTTGNWLIESLKFTTWATNTNASLGLYGIPGAGKTILCSTVIEYIKTLCSPRSESRYAYFYFDFNDPQKRTVVGMLRSLILQLCVCQSQLHFSVHELYKECGDGNQQPTLQGLVKALLFLFTTSHRTYVVLDALDECSEREELLNTISQIVQSSSGEVNIFVTSRNERDISEGLEGVIDVKINLEASTVDVDIELHVRKSLENDKKLKQWKPLIKQEMLEALVNGAHGM